MESKVIDLCEACTALHLTREEFEKPIDLLNDDDTWFQEVVISGRWVDLKKSVATCGLCRLFCHALTQNLVSWDSSVDTHDVEWAAGWAACNIEYQPLDNIESARSCSGLVPVFTNGAETNGNHCVQLFDDETTTEPFRARLPNAHANIDMLKGWIGCCRQEHGDTCHALGSVSGSRAVQTLFVDVLERCLRLADTRVKYAALSYVWGPRNEPQSRRADGSIERFMIAGAFTNLNLPQTIIDAIEVSEALGYRYLWVDSLCIVQDLKEEKLQLINAMDLIYGQADLTITAASGGSAQERLSGWHRETRVHNTRSIAHYGPDLVLGVLPEFDERFMTCPWMDRGWTLQESILSTRCLVFFEGSVYFWCRKSFWREDAVLETAEDYQKPMGTWPGIDHNEPPLSRYEQLVMDYTSRKLTYADDIQRAFLGSQSFISSLLRNTRWFHGLPAVIFDWAIMWHSVFPIPPRKLERRQGFPSWSWMGWQGPSAAPRTKELYSHPQWLIDRTWIDWYIVDNGRLLCVWEPHRDDTSTEPHLGIFQRGRAKRRVEMVPHYGMASSNNPFGRNHARRPFVQGFPTSVPPPTEESLGVPLDFPYLVFSTLKCRFQFTVLGDGQPILRDRAGLLCGIICDETLPEAFPWRNADPPLEPFCEEFDVLILSYGGADNVRSYKDHWPKDSTCYGYPKDLDYTRDGEFFDADPYFLEDPEYHEDDDGVPKAHWHSWSFFNVLIVSPHVEKSGVYERFAFGILHENALGNGLEPSTWDQICLG
ncbi:heterokaryon incompatibility protein-domain-containing protein [Hypoxylon cercidicola]|nr:heterokaryon incompatibility protein-domain-containing protein [Hypoxylon cercidicola]